MGPTENTRTLWTDPDPHSKQDPDLQTNAGTGDAQNPERRRAIRVLLPKARASRTKRPAPAAFLCSGTSTSTSNPGKTVSKLHKNMRLVIFSHCISRSRCGRRGSPPAANADIRAWSDPSKSKRRRLGTRPCRATASEEKGHPSRSASDAISNGDHGIDHPPSNKNHQISERVQFEAYRLPQWRHFEEIALHEFVHSVEYRERPLMCRCSIPQVSPETFPTLAQNNGLSEGGPKHHSSVCVTVVCDSASSRT